MIVYHQINTSSRSRVVIPDVLRSAGFGLGPVLSRKNILLGSFVHRGLEMYIVLEVETLQCKTIHYFCRHTGESNYIHGLFDNCV